jgi:hypothetical protein
MNKDAELLAEAYQRVLEEAKHCKAAIDGCDCDKCEECEDNQAVNEAKKSRRPDKDGDGVPDYADKKSGEDDNADKKGKLTQAENRERFKKMVAGKKKSMHKENAEMGEAYETILEFKQINKKFARRYNKVTAAMLKAQPGSEEYGALKTEREDLVAILRDHDQTPKDLEAFLVKKEKSNPLPDVQDPQTANQYRDSSYSDTADIPSAENEYEADMHAPQSEVAQMPPDAPAPQEVRAAQASTSQYVTRNA